MKSYLGIGMVIIGVSLGISMGLIGVVAVIILIVLGYDMATKRIE